MNTTEIIYEIARRTQSTRKPLTRKQVALVMDSLIELMMEELSLPDGEIRLRQIGIFQLKKSKYPNINGLSKGSSLSRENYSDYYYRLLFRPSSKIRKQLQ